MKDKLPDKALYGILIAVLAVTVAAVILIAVFQNRQQEELTEPLPSQSPPAASTPTPTATPAPTAYLLPLVPLGEATPTVSPPGAAASPTPSMNPIEGQYDSDTKDFMAVGLQNGKAAALFIVHLTPETLSVIAIPAETLTTVYTLDGGGAVCGASLRPIGDAAAFGGTERKLKAWNTVWALRQLTGVRLEEYLVLDVSCLAEAVSIIGPLSAGEESIDSARTAALLLEEGEQRAQSLLFLAEGMLNKLNETSFWKLSSLQRAVKGKFYSSLTYRELVTLSKCLKKVKTADFYLFPTAASPEGRQLDRAEAEKMLGRIF